MNEAEQTEYKTDSKAEGEKEMERNIDMREVSDGRLYGLKDMVKADCGGCEGCSDCCGSMGSTIILDPFDVWRLTAGLKVSFEELLEDKLELNVQEGIILPNMKTEGGDERCRFLNAEGRCSIHAFRPGLCRIFPLGRYYENRSFQYFLQVHECRKEPKQKVKVQKWIDTPDTKRNAQFITDWHYFLKDVSARLEDAESTEYQKMVNLYILKTFYQKPWQTEQDFYGQFYKRLEEAKSILKI